MATAIISKGDLFDLMGVDAFNFAMWLVGQSAQQLATKVIFDSLTEVNLASPLVQMTIQQLVDSSVISTETQVNINTKMNQLLGV